VIILLTKNFTHSASTRW